jgi:hypothetical protein
MNYWIEITNPVHGGNGWEFGTCLWSPISNKGGVKSWELMTQIKPGDIIFHLLKTKKAKGYFFVAHSVAANKAQTISDEPPEPDRWSGMSPYYRVPLSGFTQLKKSVSVQFIFDTYKSKLVSELKKIPKGQFFEQKADGRLQVSLRYVAKAIDEVMLIFQGILENQGQAPRQLELDTFTPSFSEPAYPDYTPPGSITTQVTRKIRDTVLSKKIKEEFDFKCAVCGQQISLPNGKYYAEAHHVKPLGAGHDGPDTKDNIIVLCPNHHAEFDYGVIGVDPTSGLISHKNIYDAWHGKEPTYPLKYLSKDFILYHYRIILKNS